MDQPFGSGLVQSLGDFSQRHRRRRGVAAGRIQRGSELLNQRLQRRMLRAILQAAFLRLAVRLGSIGIVGHV